jgi:hypothetical protein
MSTIFKIPNFPHVLDLDISPPGEDNSHLTAKFSQVQNRVYTIMFIRHDMHPSVSNMVSLRLFTIDCVLVTLIFCSVLYPHLNRCHKDRGKVFNSNS